MNNSTKTTSLTVKPKLEDNAQFYTLSAAVYSALADIQADESQFDQFLHYAIEGYKEFHFDQAHSIDVQEIEMRPEKTIRVPANYVDWVKVGYKVGDTIHIITRGMAIPKTFDLVNGVPQENQPGINNLDLTSTDLIPLWNHCGWGQNMYGLAVYNPNGYFDYDPLTRCMNFKGTVKGMNTIYLEYISDGINYRGQTLINPLAFRLIKLWIHWQRKENDDRVGLGEKDRAQRLYEKEVDKVAIRMLDLTIDDIKEALRSGNKQTPKL